MRGQGELSAPGLRGTYPRCPKRRRLDTQRCFARRRSTMLSEESAHAPRAMCAKRRGSCLRPERRMMLQSGHVWAMGYSIEAGSKVSGFGKGPAERIPAPCCETDPRSKMHSQAHADWTADRPERGMTSGHATLRKLMAATQVANNHYADTLGNASVARLLPHLSSALWAAGGMCARNCIRRQSLKPARRLASARAGPTVATWSRPHMWIESSPKHRR